MAETLPPAPETLPSVPEDWHRALAVVAHPDDLEYGTASAVARWTSQGKEVAYVLVTDGEAGIDGLSPAEAAPVRREEQRRSAAVVGVDQVEFLGYPDGLVEADHAAPQSRPRSAARPDVVRSTGDLDSRVEPRHHRNVGVAARRGPGRGNCGSSPSRRGGPELWPGVRFVALGNRRTTHGWT